MNRIQVGELYNPEITNWVESVNYLYRSGFHDLLIFLNNPTPVEIENVKESPGRFYLYRHKSALFFSFKFGNFSGDSSFTYHLLTEDEQIIPNPLEGDEERDIITTTLIDANTGIVLAIRICSLSHNFSNKLREYILEQAGAEFNLEAYAEHCEEVQGKYSTLQIMEFSPVTTGCGE